MVIHCGDMTEESKLDEFRTTIQMMMKLRAPLKLIIPGNHDFSLDVPMFQRKLAEAKLTEKDDAVIKAYGPFGEAQNLFDEEDAKHAGLVLLTEGTHRFTLANGASLTVYASPYTPSTNDWGFQYDPQEDHVWDIGTDVNVAITHGPGLGVFDQTGANTRAGSASLFKAIAHGRPQMHCFGHMHASWGAKTVTWRENVDEESEISHFTAIDNDKSSLVESLTTLQPRKFDTDEVKAEKKDKLEAYTRQGYCVAADGVEAGKQTLFVNAAIEGIEEYPKHLPWMVNIALPRAESRKKRAVEEVDEFGDGEDDSKRARTL